MLDKHENHMKKPIEAKSSEASFSERLHKLESRMHKLESRMKKVDLGSCNYCRTLKRMERSFKDNGLKLSSVEHISSCSDID